MWKNYLDDRRLQLIATGLVSSVIGGVVGYMAASKRLEAKYAQIANQEIADVKRHYATIKTETKPALSELAQKVEDLGYVPSSEEMPPIVDTEEVDDEKRNIFESFEPETYWDPEQEAVRRLNDPLIPYVITKDEFDQGERGFEQVSITYYEGDSVLADTRDAVVDDQDGTVGSSNLIRFGQASGDRNVVYVRNERLELDIEVLRSEGDYAKEVLGFIQHSDKQGIRKFRGHWD